MGQRISDNRKTDRIFETLAVFDRFMPIGNPQRSRPIINVRRFGIGIHVAGFILNLPQTAGKLDHGKDFDLARQLLGPNNL